MANIFLMWRNTRMIVLVAVCAAIYAATLIAFKTAIPLIPGITEVRVANVFPMTFGLLFGPAGAWGLAFGNLIGDIFGGTFGPGSLAGFFGNFLLGYLPYTMWTALVPFTERSYGWNGKSWRSWTGYTLITLVSSAACAVVIGAFVDALGIVPYEVLSKLITVNNTIGGLIGIVLLIAVYDVTVNQLGLLWTDIMDVPEPVRSRTGSLGAWIVTAGALIGIAPSLVPSLPAPTVGWLGTVLIVAGSLLL
ncbi:MAG: QueT transporter family protein [Deltaproteobacteria bacterium]|nr:QueT transporter family protein [Deltaproteobacteria bacterium]